jgi:hypothetical protein
MTELETQKPIRTIQVNPGQTTTVVLDTLVRPIYPVRYAYANFFEDNLQPAARPPALKTMLNQKGVEDTHGYVARLLRPGWIYIKEETGGDYFHMFRYKHLVQPDGTVQEQFHKYMFRNKVNAQKGVLPEKIGAHYRGYPFAFVRKEVTEVSMVYSEHGFSNQIIDELNSNAEKRAQCMQRINLENGSDCTVNASGKNLKALIEDYREQQERVMALNVDSSDPTLQELDKVGLDVLTTQNTYDMSPWGIASELMQKTPYGEVAQIVGLYDPVGIQKDIAEIHAKLTLWERHYASSQLYSYTIGAIVQNLRNLKNDDIQDVLKDGINLKEHDDFWQPMEQTHQHFQTRKNQFIQLYRAFMVEPQLIEQVGSLDTYFSHFFAEPEDEQDANQQLQLICPTLEDLFNGIAASPAGLDMLEELLLNEHSGLFKILKTLRKTLTLKQWKVQWQELTVKALDKVMIQLGSLLGKVTATIEAAPGKTQAWLVNDFMALIFSVYGLKIDTEHTVSLTTDELAKILANALTNGNPRSTITHAAAQAEQKMQRGQKLFDWGQQSLAQRTPTHWRLPTVLVSDDAKARYHLVATHTGETLTIATDGAFAGLSVLFSVQTLWGLAHQHRFDTLNPLNHGHVSHDLIKLSSALMTLTTDTLTALNASAKLLNKSMPERLVPWAANRLAPKLLSASNALKTVLASQAINRIIAVANLVAAADAFWNAAISFQQGNTGEMTGNIMVGTGSTVLFAMAGWAIAAGATAAPETLGIGFLVGSVVGLALVITGAITTMIYGKSDFENLLANCFWGSGKRYMFWSNKDRRPVYNKRMESSLLISDDKVIQTAYQLELQEFMNYLYQPVLKLGRDKPFIVTDSHPQTYRYTFTLPGFVAGLSDIHCKIYALKANTGYSAYWEHGAAFTWQPDAALTDAFKQCLAQATLVDKGALTELSLQFATTENIRLHWHYEPQPGIITPRRYLTKTGVIDQPITGMTDETYS